MIRRALWALVAVLALRLVMVVAARPAAPGPLMTAAQGELTTLGLQFHRQGAERFLPVFGEIVAGLDADTTVHAVVGDAEDEALLRAAWPGWGSAATLEVSRAGHVITSWMRDRLAVLGAGEALLAPGMPMTGPEERARDWKVPWVLGEALGLPVQRARYRFDGGDLIADEERVYVASPLFARNPDLERAELLRMLEEDLGRPVLALDPAPDHHLGMFVTPLGGGRVAVGDPDLALELLGGEGRVLDLDGELRLAQDLEPFRAVIAQLEEAGLDVVRLPLWPSDQPWVWLSYDNVLMETRDGRLRVWLPTYGEPTLDAGAVAIWEGLGAEVLPVDVASVFRLGGSVRCLTAPLARRH